MNQPLPPAHVSHRLPGRTRLRIPAHRHDAGFFRHIAERLTTCPGVRGVRANPKTASLLIDHDGDLEALADFAVGCRLFALDGMEIGEPPLAKRLRDDAGHLDRAVRRVAGGEVDLWTAVAVTFFALAAWQTRRGNVMGPATSLLWAGLGALRRARAAGHSSSAAPPDKGLRAESGRPGWP